MSEYTPTTREVRIGFAEWACPHLQASCNACDPAGEFDRMIAEVERAAAEKAWTEGVRSAEQFYQSHNPAYGKTPLPMPVNPYRRNEGAQNAVD